MKFSRTLPAALVSGSLALALALFPSPARAETSAEIQARVNEAYAKLQEYTMELELANGELQTVTAELEETRGQIAQTEEEIERTEEEISRKEREIAQGQQAISDRLSDSYKHGGTSLLDVVLGSSDFDELFSNLFYANRIADYDAELVEQVKEDRVELRQQQDALQRQQEQLAEQESAQSELVAEQQAHVDDVNARVAAQESYYEELDQDLKDKLAEEEAIRIAEEEARRQQELQQQQQGGSAGGSASGNTNTDSGNAPSSVVDIALAQVGKPYVWAAGGPGSFDCSGLTSYAYAQVGVSIPHQSQQQYNLVARKGHLVYDIGSLKPGDLVFWGNGGSASAIYHVGVYIGGGRYVHASSPGVGVITSTLGTGGNYVGGGSPV
ncbi:C40 family peptidase [Olsenella sp. An270]|uniref:C40 family peptidase n=1 Tax=Olsenella sp. An270 TaxID=1965615 RepID=UPI000B37EA29|nr:C40 family peptidase [Olsenella sp. An270]OUO60719.1 hypothetical protein B5F73_00185 [Olsenella sp. An270]